MRLPNRPLLNLYSDKSSLVLRALLREPSRKWTISDLMKEGLSAGQVVNVIKNLETTGFIERNVEWRNHSVQLVDPKALLEAWAQVYSFHWNWQAWYSTDKPDFLEQLCEYLKEKKIPTALTMISASQLIAPYVMQKIDHVYIDIDRKNHEKTLRDIEKRFFLKYPERSGNICIAVPFYKSSVFRDARKIDGYPVVSDLQLYLDLVGFPITGADQADQLKNTLAEKGTPLIGGR